MGEAISRNLTGAPVLFLFYTPHIWQPHTPKQDMHTCTHSVSLAISTANVDLANSDSLKFVQFVDPQGWLTIGISLHLMGMGTHALDMMAHSSSTFLLVSSLPSLVTSVSSFRWVAYSCDWTG